MSKRKTPYAESSSHLGVQEENTDSKPQQPFYKKQRQIDEKKGELSRKSTLTLDLMPKVLLVHTASFLTITSLTRLTLVSKLFLIVNWEDALLPYRKALMDFQKLHSQDDSVISRIDSQECLVDVTFWRLFKKIPEQFRLFSTIIDKSYIPLFIALLSSDQESAIDFIRYKLKSTAGTNENVTGLVFLQKKWDGETAIMLANRLGLQDFLNHCFLHLIENAPDQKTLPKGQKIPIKTGKLESVLARLDTEMCAEALWLYALVDSCNQTTLREKISSKTLWDKIYFVSAIGNNPDHGLNLAVIAALLGNRSLMNYVLEEIINDDESDLMHFDFLCGIDQIYYNKAAMPVTALAAALLGNNVELVNDLLPRTLHYLDPKDTSTTSLFLVPLLLFYIKHQNRSKLAECLKTFVEVNGRLLVDGLRVYPQYLGIDAVGKRYNELLNEGVCKASRKASYNVLNVAIDSEWKAGADLLLSTAAQLIHEGKGKNFLYSIIKGDNLPVLEELVARGISLSIKYSVPEVDHVDHLEYPLITAIRVAKFYEGICDFIIKQIGVEAAIQQIDDRQKNFIGDNEEVIEGLSNYRESLEGSSKTEKYENGHGDKIVEDIKPPLSSPGVLSFLSTERSSQTTSVPSGSSPTP